MSARKKILVIDDEESVHISLNTEFGEEYAITSARTKEEAKYYLNANSNFDLAIVDLVLSPEINDDAIDGFDLVEEIGKLEIPVIIFSNRYHVRDFRKGLKKGATEFVTKKEYADDSYLLTNTIRNILNPKKS